MRPVTHPIMFEESDPLLARVRQIALAFPGAREKISHGRPAFYTQRVFCHFGGSQHPAGEWIAHDHAILIRLDPDDEQALRQDPRFWVPGYLGPSGWLGLDLDGSTDWDEVVELIDASYRRTAPRTLVRELDARGAG